MRRKNRPHVATLDEVQITRDGDFAIIAYQDDTIETTQYRIGAERLSRMSDEDILMIWNAGLATNEEEVARSRRDMKGLLAGGTSLVCSVSAFPRTPDQPFINVGGRLYSAMELAQLLGGHVGWDVTLELHRPEGPPSIPGS